MRWLNAAAQLEPQKVPDTFVGPRARWSRRARWAGVYESGLLGLVTLQIGQ